MLSWFPRFLLLTVFAGLLFGINRKKRKLPTSHSVADVDPAVRSMEDWQSLPTKSVRLACDQAHLVVTGLAPGTF